jgi:hypothetical protein
MIPRLLVLAVAIAAVSGCGGGANRASDDFIEVPGIGETRIDVPRPTTGTSAVCAADPFPPASKESIAERVAALRAVGLFADRSDLDHAALAAEVEAGIADVWGDSLEPDDPLLDLIVAEEDHQRVWWQDLEADVADGNDVYVETLQGWAAISQGAFEPAGITENWESGEGPVTIAFSLGGEPQEITPAYLEDWIDPGILTPINELIVAAGRRFELYKSFDQTAFVMALTDLERQGLEARGWCFE